MARLVNAAPPGGDRARPLDDRTDAHLCAARWRASFAPGDEVVVTDLRPRIEYRPLAGAEGARRRVQDLVASIARPSRSTSPNSTAHDAERRSSSASRTPRTFSARSCRSARSRGIVHAAGAQLCVDGVAYAPHRAVDVAALGADYYVFSFYKTYGPHFAMHGGALRQSARARRPVSLLLRPRPRAR